jgi:hypothetical protein
MHTLVAETQKACHLSRLALAGAAVAAVIVISAPALAEDAPDPLNDTWNLSLGLYGLETQTDVSVDGKLGDRGTKVDWERTFGEDGSQNRFRLDAQWRFADRHKLQMMWFDSNLSNTRTIDREIEWEGETYPIGAKLKGTMDFYMIQLDYEYAFWRRDTYEISASIGAYYASWDAGISATFDDPDVGTVTQKGDASLAAPLPVLGLRGQWVLPYNLSLDVSGQWFYLSIDQYDGNLQDYRAALTWQPKSWLGLGLGYDWFAADANVDQSNFHGSLDWQFNGPMIFYNVSF